LLAGGSPHQFVGRAETFSTWHVQPGLSLLQDISMAAYGQDHIPEVSRGVSEESSPPTQLMAIAALAESVERIAAIIAPYLIALCAEVESGDAEFDQAFSHQGQAEVIAKRIVDEI
jgi:hypothetical protein